MIFATVGTPPQPFDRFVRAVDEFASTTPEKVIIQTGTAVYLPCFAEYFCWAPSTRMDALTQQARLVISQASAGAVILAFNHHKPVVIVPRMSKFGEHFNDHQLQLAAALQASGQAVILEDVSAAGLEKAIQTVTQQKQAHGTRSELIGHLKSQLQIWQK